MSTSALKAAYLGRGPDALGHLQNDIAYHLDQITGMFKPGVKITVVVRNPSISDEAGLVMGDDDLDEAIAEIRRRQSNIAEQK